MSSQQKFDQDPSGPEKGRPKVSGGLSAVIFGLFVVYAGAICMSVDESRVFGFVLFIAGFFILFYGALALNRNKKEEARRSLSDKQPSSGQSRGAAPSASGYPAKKARTLRHAPVSQEHHIYIEPSRALKEEPGEFYAKVNGQPVYIDNQPSFEDSNIVVHKLGKKNQDIFPD